jgi:hypothetical protein
MPRSAHEKRLLLRKRRRGRGLFMTQNVEE